MLFFKSTSPKQKNVLFYQPVVQNWKSYLRTGGNDRLGCQSWDGYTLYSQLILSMPHLSLLMKSLHHQETTGIYRHCFFLSLNQLRRDLTWLNSLSEYHTSLLTCAQLCQEARSDLDYEHYFSSPIRFTFKLKIIIPNVIVKLIENIITFQLDLWTISIHF